MMGCFTETFLVFEALFSASHYVAFMYRLFILLKFYGIVSEDNKNHYNTTAYMTLLRTRARDLAPITIKKA